MYGVGFAIAAMAGVALGGSLAAEYGRARVLPFAILGTIVCGAVLGWALNGWIAYAQASASH